MRFGALAVLVMAIGLGVVGRAQDAPATGGLPGQGPGAGGRGMGRGMGMGGGSGVMGTVTEIAADHFTIKNSAGETWTVNFSVNTRFVKQPPPLGNVGGPAVGVQGDGAAPESGEGRRGMGFAGPPTPIQSTEIKLGDVLMAGGEVNRDAKTVGAVGVMLVDPERAKQMQAMEANFGKTWLMGRVTAINDTLVTVQGGPSNASHTFVADENTTFRRRREPVTLGDVQVGDTVRVDGALKDGQFVATRVNVIGQPGQGGPMRQGPPR